MMGGAAGNGGGADSNVAGYMPSNFQVYRFIRAPWEKSSKMKRVGLWARGTCVTSAVEGWEQLWPSCARAEGRKNPQLYGMSLSTDSVHNFVDESLVSLRRARRMRRLLDCPVNWQGCCVVSDQAVVS